VGTFKPIQEYPWARRSSISPSEPVVELTVDYAVTDIRDLVIEVTIR